MRPLASVMPCTMNCQAAVLPAQRLCSCTPTPAAGLPRLVSSMCVVMGERPGCPLATAQHAHPLSVLACCTGKFPFLDIIHDCAGCAG
jgi:hypothetical protein